MKPTTLLTLLFSISTSAATLRSPPTRPRDAPHHRLLHTLTPSPPSAAGAKSNGRLLAAASSSSSSTNTNSDSQSTQGGALLTLSPPTTNTTDDNLLITSVHATFLIPAALPPTTGPTANNPTGEYAASFWVGIGSTTTTTTSSGPCGASSAALRAGVDVFWDGSAGGVQAPFAWWQFGGAGEAGLQGEEAFTGNGTASGGFVVAAGDVVRFTLSVGSGTDSGQQGQVVEVLAENFGGNVSCVDEAGVVAGGAKPVRSVRQVVPVGAAQLCRTQAAWVVEDFPLAEVPDLPVALANFTSVTFAGAGAVLADGSKREVAGAQVLDINQQAQGGKLTSCEVVGGTSVKCTRVVGDE